MSDDGDPLDDHYVDRMQALARRWNLNALHQELLDAMGETSVGRSVYVPSRLVNALDMFLDSYGGKPGGID